LRGISYAKSDFEFSLENPVKLGAGEYEKIVRPVVNMRNIHGSDFVCNKKTRAERDVGNYAVGIEKFILGLV
jgi:hypothetical protein